MNESKPLSNHTPDPVLFGPGPARDARFTVVDRWVDCSGFPDGHPEKEVEFFHRQMHEELCSVENAARNLADFPDADWDLRMRIARQCADEARHVLMFRQLCEKRGGHVGAWPVMTFQYRICSKIDTLIGRLSVQNRTFEAGGIDAVTVGIAQCRDRGDIELALLYEMQGADEIQHVRFANDWIRCEVRRDARNVMRMIRGLQAGTAAFEWVMGTEGVAGISYGADVDGRREAGFDEVEIQVAFEDMEERRLRNLARGTATGSAAEGTRN